MPRRGKIPIAREVEIHVLGFQVLFFFAFRYGCLGSMWTWEAVLSETKMRPSQDLQDPADKGFLCEATVAAVAYQHRTRRASFFCKLMSAARVEVGPCSSSASVGTILS